MKKITLYILSIAALLLCASCAKESEYNQTLGLLSKYNQLDAAGGSTQVAVFSNTSWTVEMDRIVSWASIDRFQGYKTGHIVFDYEINYGRSRRVLLVFKAGGETRTLNMFQKAGLSDSDCVMTLGTSSVAATADGKTEDIAFTTNLIYNLDEMFLTIEYPAGDEPATPWITLKSVTKNQVTIEIAPNTTGAARTASVRLSHTDAGAYDSTEGDTIYSNTLTITQSI